MLSISRRISSCALGAIFLVAVVPVVHIVNGQRQLLDVVSMIPESILSAIPDDCRGNDDAEFETAVNCGVANLGDCRGLLGLIPEFGNIPTASEVEECDDINVPYCLFADACEICSSDFEALVTCVVLKSEGLDQNTTDLIDSCSLGCGGDITAGNTTEVSEGNTTEVSEGIIDNILSPIP